MELASKRSIPANGISESCDHLPGTLRGSDNSSGLKPAHTSNASARLFAKPVLRILSKFDGETAGYIYEWNNGERQPMWISGKVSDVTYAPISSDSTQIST
jgi:hypothetical protein